MQRVTTRIKNSTKTAWTAGGLQAEHLQHWTMLQINCKATVAQDPQLQEAIGQRLQKTTSVGHSGTQMYDQAPLDSDIQGQQSHFWTCQPFSESHGEAEAGRREFWGKWYVLLLPIISITFQGQEDQLHLQQGSPKPSNSSLQHYSNSKNILLLLNWFGGLRGVTVFTHLETLWFSFHLDTIICVTSIFKPGKPSLIQLVDCMCPT